MDQSRLLFLVQILVIYQVFSYTPMGSGHLQNVRTDFDLPGLTSKVPFARNSESGNIATREGDVVYAFRSQARKKGVKRNLQRLGARRHGNFVVSVAGTSTSSDEDVQSHTVAASLRTESASAAANKAFQSYLERADYFGSRRSQYPSAHMTFSRDHTASVDSLTTVVRRTLSSALESASDGPFDKRTFEQSSKIFEQSFMYLIVSQAGDGDFTTVQDAVDFVREGNTQRIIVRIRSGIYREKVVVPRNKPYITFHGDDARNTVITWNATAASRVALAAHPFNASDDLVLFGTMDSASVTVLSDFFVAQNLAFENSAPAPKPGAENSQAVAFLIAGDTAALYDCCFLGAQDTLYDYKGRHYYHRCFIQGSIDFIFGNGRTLFENCTLSSIATRFGAIAAQQRRTPDEDTGFAFVGCYVTGTGSVYLGRAWSPFAKIVFAHSYFEDIIDAEGWSDFGDAGRHDTTYFGLYKCSGPGAKLARLVPWSRNLTVDEVRPYLGQNYVNGQEWLGDASGNSTLPQDSGYP